MQERRMINMQPEVWTLIGTIFVGICSVLGVVITNNKANRDFDAKLDKAQAITDYKIEELTREVRLHNDFAKRIPVIEEQMKVVNHRIEDIEKQHGGN